MNDSCLYKMCKFLEKWEEMTQGKSMQTTSKVRAFLELNLQKGITTGEVARKIDVSQPTMYRAVKKFEEFELGVKESDPFDAKSYIFVPSKKGKDLLDILD